jgi:hypothetical protein
MRVDEIARANGLKGEGIKPFLENDGFSVSLKSLNYYFECEIELEPASGENQFSVLGVKVS